MREPPEGSDPMATTCSLTSSSLASTVTPTSTSVMRTRGLLHSLDELPVLEFVAGAVVTADGAVVLAGASVVDDDVSVVAELSDTDGVGAELADDVALVSGLASGAVVDVDGEVADGADGAVVSV